MKCAALRTGQSVQFLLSAVCTEDKQRSFWRKCCISERKCWYFSQSHPAWGAWVEILDCGNSGHYGKKNGGNTEGYRKYDKLFSAVETGKDLKNVISVYTSNGVSNKELASQISEKYRPIMQDLYKTNRTEYANLQARILTAYQVLGYDRNQKLKDIQKWVK